MLTITIFCEQRHYWRPHRYRITNNVAAVRREQRSLMDVMTFTVRAAKHRCTVHTGEQPR